MKKPKMKVKCAECGVRIPQKRKSYYGGKLICQDCWNFIKKNNYTATQLARIRRKLL